MADRTTLAMTTDARIEAEQEWMMPYTFWSDGIRIEIHPGRQEFVDLWNGNLRIDDMWFVGDDLIGWNDTFAALRVDVQTTDGSRVELREVALEVQESMPYLRPMLRLERHLGCTGFRPTFQFENLGWGPVEDPSLTVRFVDEAAFMADWPDPSFENLPGTEAVSLDLESFDIGSDVDLRPALSALGVDLVALERAYFDCSAHDVSADCLPAVLDAADFGQLAPFVQATAVPYADSPDVAFQGAFLYTALAYGVLEYRWTDASGWTFDEQQTFEVMISLAVSERRPYRQAEGGMGSAFPVMAPDFVDAELPVDGASFRIATRPRGNPGVSSFAGLFRLYSAASSIHDFTAVAVFGDGSERRSLPATFYFLKPRLERFASQATPAECVMPPLLQSDYETGLLE